VRSCAVGRRSLLLIAALLVGALALRLGRLPLAWNYWALDYLSYPLVHRDELAHGHVAWTRLTGLHPPLWSLLAAAIGAMGGGVRAMWALSLALSLGAIGITAAVLARRAGAGPAALGVVLLGLSPLQAHYALDLNNYPLYLFGSALLALGLDRALGGRGPGWAFAGALLCLHGHLAGHALVLAGAAIAAGRRRWALLGALGAAELLALPITAASWARFGGEGTFHNERPGAIGLVHDLLATWPQRFGPLLGLAAIGAAVLWLGGRALKRPQTRDPATILAAIGGAGLAATAAGLLSGAAFVGQTPYWLQPSWALLTLAALGSAGLGRSGGAARALLLLPWALPAADRALRPLADLAPDVGAVEPPRWDTLPLAPPLAPPPAGVPEGRGWGPPGLPAGLSNSEANVPGSWWRTVPVPGAGGPRVRRLPAGDPGPLRAWLSGEAADVLLWIWEPAFLNDDPRGWDPLFAALSPSDVGDLRPPDEPYPGFCRDRREGGVICFLNQASLRGGDAEAELRAALLRWRAEGADIDVVFARLDPDQIPPDPRRMRRAMQEAGSTWTDAFVGLSWVVQVR
jgi:hypothetical protein